MCLSVRLSLSKVGLHQIADAELHTQDLAFFRNRGSIYRSTIRESLRRLAKGRRRRLDPERPTSYLPCCLTAGPRTHHPRGAAPTGLYVE